MTSRSYSRSDQFVDRRELPKPIIGERRNNAARPNKVDRAGTPRRDLLQMFNSYSNNHKKVKTPSLKANFDWDDDDDDDGSPHR